mgnify:FL=1
MDVVSPCLEIIVAVELPIPTCFHGCFIIKEQLVIHNHTIIAVASSVSSLFPTFV